jgi:lysophospholipase L1-like esterase
MKRLPLVALLLGALLAWGAMPVLAEEDHHDGQYLALGDSVPFGFSPFVAPRDADGFMGYPEDLARMLDIGVKNAACPGETSGSLMSPVTLTNPDNGCQAFRSVGHLHVSYQGTQLSYALDFLRAHRHTSLVTITIGANDIFLLQAACKGDVTCVAGMLRTTLGTIGGNLTAIYAAIRGTGYQGKIVALTYYLTDYTSALQLQVIGALDQVVSQVTLAAGGTVADGFGAFAAVAALKGGDSCAAGLLIKLPGGGCNIHPSARGARVLARAVRAVLGNEEQGD